MTPEEQKQLRRIVDIEAYRADPLGAFRADLDRIRPRFMDTYILPVFMVWFAWASKSSMGRWPRRILFAGGMYMLYRNARIYREIPAKLAALMREREETAIAQLDIPQEY